jgi:hypothetical protein
VVLAATMANRSHGPGGAYDMAKSLSVLFGDGFRDQSYPSPKSVLRLIEPYWLARRDEKPDQGAAGDTLVGLVRCPDRSNRLSAGECGIKLHNRSDPLVGDVVTSVSLRNNQFGR